MSKLLDAGFARLWKDKLFYLEMIMFCITAAVACCTQFREVKNWNAEIHLEDAFFNCTPFILLFSAAFIALFTGSEYSDGTIRNKLIVGHTRFDVYLAELIVNGVAMLIVYSAHLIVAFALGLPMFGFFTIPMSQVLLTLFDALIMIIALSALFTMLTMLMSSKASSAVACLILVCAFFFMGMVLQSNLTEPEMYTDYVVIENNAIVMGDPVPNPRYITGIKRQVYQFLLDFIPMGQAIHVANYNAFQWYYPLYSLIMIAITTVPGILVFRRKDIK